MAAIGEHMKGGPEFCQTLLVGSWTSVAAAPFLVPLATVEGGSSAYVLAANGARAAWTHGSVRLAGYFGMGAVGAGTGYGLLTDQNFRGEFITAEMATGLPGEGLLLFGRGLQMAGRDARTWMQGFDYLEFANRANSRCAFQILPEPLYIVPPASRPSFSRTWPTTWDGARARYWTDLGRAEYLKHSGWYSQANILEMLAGRSPKIRAQVRLPGGMLEVRDIPIELHHYLLSQRSGSIASHEPWNLVPSLPWTHASMDEFRHIDFELIRIINGPNSWKP
jgi:hypothetical protein